MDIPDVENPLFTARCSWTMTPIGEARSQVVLDARATMKFTAVSLDGKPCTFTHEKDLLTIDLPGPVQVGQNITLAIDYTAEKPYGSLGGFLGPTGLSWFKTRRGRENLGAQIYSQGEAQWNSYWFPCRDLPDERITSELIVTAQDPYKVISNGRLSSIARTGERTTWHWKQDKPHAPYLVSLIVGKFDVITLGGPGSARPDLEIPVYAPLGSGEAARVSMARTPEMIALLERLTGEPYPWDKYAQTLVRNFPGGMENTSATTMGEFIGRAGPGGGDEIIVHELGHQWFGDLVTCRSWAHLWLNEGWATYVEHLWAEHVGGRDGYYRSVGDALAGFASRNRATLPTGVPMVSNRYQSPDDTFSKTDNVYAKGGLVLHALRQRLGDEAFWAGVRLYFSRHRYQVVETDDFRKAMEDASGQSLERFFWQYCERAGVPVLSINADWDAGAGALKVMVEQTQTIDGNNPAYALTVPIYAEMDGGGRWVYVDTDQQKVEAMFPLSGKPTRISVDPNCSVIGDFKVKTALALDRRPGDTARLVASPAPDTQH